MAIIPRRLAALSAALLLAGLSAGSALPVRQLTEPSPGPFVAEGSVLGAGVDEKIKSLLGGLAGGSTAAGAEQIKSILGGAAGASVTEEQIKSILGGLTGGASTASPEEQLRSLLGGLAGAFPAGLNEEQIKNALTGLLGPNASISAERIKALLPAMVASMLPDMKNLPDWSPTKDASELRVSGTRVVPGLIDCPCSPTERGTQSDTEKALADTWAALDAFLKQNSGLASGTVSVAQLQGLAKLRKPLEAMQKALKKCISDYRLEGCINADKVLRGVAPMTICKYDRETGRNVVGDVTVGSCASDPRFNLQADKSKNEGCVAVEHLEGYVLQHPAHLRRPVLCARGFCATPNHGIYVNGEYTSMKQMCSAGGPWECTESVKLVNNLKIAANRRAKVSDEITVTPYDVRFPKPAIWAVQILEDVWNMLSLSVCTGTLAGVAVLLLSRVDKSK